MVYSKETKNNTGYHPMLELHTMMPLKTDLKITIFRMVCKAMNLIPIVRTRTLTGPCTSEGSMVSPILIPKI